MGSAIVGRRSSSFLHPERQKLLNRISRDPWEMLVGVDPLTDRPLTWTRNEKSPEGKDPFPDKEYLKKYIRALQTYEMLFVPKSRQMIISTATLVLTLWEIMFKPSWRAILSKVTEDEAEELIENKVRFTYRELPQWLRDTRTIKDQPAGKALCKETSSYILAAAQNVADRECRGGTANRLIVDEACYQDYTKSIVEAGGPMTDRMVLISTPNVSYPGGRFMRAAIYDESMDNV